jgi:anthranilate phosphoribosyltransferase
MNETEIIRSTVESFRNGEDLADRDIPCFFDSLLNEQDEDLLGSILKAWTKKGFTENELFGLASIMRQRCIRIDAGHDIFVDIVGSGGSRTKTFNVSTAAAFIVAGAGIPVAKHGNRAASSNSGSADVLQALGIDPAVDAATVSNCLREIGICFMFAPNFHRLSPVLGKVRRALGFPTVFNILGPLCNPAAAPHQIIGVWDHKLAAIVARVLARLGTRRSWVVSGMDGLDEITLDGETRIFEVKGADVRDLSIRPEDFGLSQSKLDSLRVASPAESAGLIRRIVSGRENGQPSEDLVLLSAAAAINVTTETHLPAAIELARESIRSGAAESKLFQLAGMTNK